jgi:hypothetical protein
LAASPTWSATLSAPAPPKDAIGPSARRRYHDGEPVREIARSYNVSHNTISRLSA